MLIGGEALLATARIPAPVPARRHRLLRARRRRDGRERADPVPGRPHGRRDPRGQRRTCGRSRWRWWPPDVLRLVFSILRRLVAGRVSLGVEYDLRNRMYEHLQSLELAFFDQQQTGQLMSRATVDLQSVRFFLGYGLVFILQSAITIVIAAAVMVDAEPGPRAGGAGADAAGRLDRVPLRAAQPAGVAGGAAAHRGADRRGRGEHRRRARGQGVRAGAAPAAPLQHGRRAGVRPVDGVDAAARLLRAVDRVPPAARPGGAAARRRAARRSTGGSRSASSSRSTATC